MLYYTILHYTTLHYTILILYYTMLCYAMLCYTMLYYTILFYTILHYTILYYTILPETRCAASMTRGTRSRRVPESCPKTLHLRRIPYLRRTLSPSSKNPPIFEEPPIFDLRSRRSKNPPSSIFGAEDRRTCPSYRCP